MKKLKVAIILFIIYMVVFAIIISSKPSGLQEENIFGGLLSESQNGPVKVYSGLTQVEANSPTKTVVSINGTNIWLVMISIKAYDDEWDSEVAKASYKLEIQPPNGLDCIFDPSNKITGETEKGKGVDVYLADIPWYTNYSADSLSQAKKIAHERYNTTNGTGDWTFIIEWIEPSVFGLSDGGDVSISISIWQYEIFVGGKDIWMLISW